MANEEVKKQEFKKSNNRNKRNNRREKGPFVDTQVVSINRVTKVTKGGRTLRFAVVCAVGNKKGLVGIGTGKAGEVQDAIRKAENAAKNNLIKIPLVDNRTLPHDVTGKCGRAKVLLKSAKPGTGVIAGGTARIILELAGVKDVVSKSLGSNTKINVAKATISALKDLRTKEHIAELRGKKVEEL